MARYIETRRLDETVIYINADRVDFVYEASSTGQAVVSFGTQELVIQMSANDFRAKAEGIGIATSNARAQDEIRAWSERGITVIDRANARKCPPEVSS